MSRTLLCVDIDANTVTVTVIIINSVSEMTPHILNRGRLCVCHHQKHSGMFCVTDPHLGAVDDVIILVFLCFSLESERVAARLRLRQTEAADLKKRSRIISHRNTSECQRIVRESHRIAGQSRQIELLLLLRALVHQQRVYERVLNVAQHRHWRVHLRQLLDHQDGGEEGGARASVLRSDLDPHQLTHTHTQTQKRLNETVRRSRCLWSVLCWDTHTLLEQSTDYARIHHRVLIHLGDKRGRCAPGRISSLVREEDR